MRRSAFPVSQGAGRKSEKGIVTTPASTPSSDGYASYATPAAGSWTTMRLPLPLGWYQNETPLKDDQSALSERLSPV
jgi:hypothetical protein